MSKAIPPAANSTAITAKRHLPVLDQPLVSSVPMRRSARCRSQASAAPSATSDLGLSSAARRDGARSRFTRHGAGPIGIGIGGDG